jgi:hypothetical protein
MGVGQGGGSTSPIDKLNLAVDVVGLYFIGVSKEERVG